MKFKNRADRNGYVFGKICRVLGAFFTLVFLPFLASEENLINKKMILPVIISFIAFYYGAWRTGGIHYD